MKVKHGRSEQEFDREMTVRRLLEVMDIVAEGVVVAVNGELVTTDTTIRVGDNVEIIRAISGGRGGHDIGIAGAGRAACDVDTAGAGAPIR